MQTIALIGLGAMGRAFAARWRAAGFPLVVANRSPAKAEALALEGVIVAKTPAEAAAGADIIVAMVTDDDASRAVLLGPSGALAGAKPDALLIEMSTISPAFARELAGAANTAGLSFLDAPVAGGPAAAAAGGLTIFVGGPAAALQTARPVLSAVASRIEHLGAAGAGATWKLINYMMAGAQLASLAEALTLAERAGVAPARAADLISKSVVASPAVLAKLPRMIEGRFTEPDAALRLVAKDQRYALDLAHDLGADPALLPVVAEIFRRAEKDGFGDLDLAAIMEWTRRRRSDA